MDKGGEGEFPAHIEGDLLEKATELAERASQYGLTLSRWQSNTPTRHYVWAVHEGSRPVRPADLGGAIVKNLSGRETPGQDGEAYRALEDMLKRLNGLIEDGWVFCLYQAQPDRDQGEVKLLSGHFTAGSAEIAMGVAKHNWEHGPSQNGPVEFFMEKANGEKG